MNAKRKCKAVQPNGKTAAVKFRHMDWDHPFAKEMCIDCNGFRAWNLPAFKAASKTHDENELIEFVAMLQHDVAVCCLLIDELGKSCRHFEWCLENGIGKTVAEHGRLLFDDTLNIPKVADDRRIPFIIELDNFANGASNIAFTDVPQTKFPFGGHLTSQCIIYTIDDAFKGFTELLKNCQEKFPGCAAAAENLIIDVEEFVPTMIGGISVTRVREIRRNFMAHLRTMRIALSNQRNATIVEQLLKEIKNDTDFLKGKKQKRIAKGKAAQKECAKQYAAEKARAKADMKRAIARVKNDPGVKAKNHGAIAAACRRVCKEFTPMGTRKNEFGRCADGYAPLTDYLGKPIKPKSLERNYRKSCPPKGDGK